MLSKFTRLTLERFQRLLWCPIQLILSTFCILLIHFPESHDKFSLLCVLHSECLVFGFCGCGCVFSVEVISLRSRLEFEIVVACIEWILLFYIFGYVNFGKYL